MSEATATLPAALAVLKPLEVGARDGGAGSFCVLHGRQDGLNCSKCDEHFPGIAESRKQAAGPIVGILPGDVQKMVDAAVQAAVKEALAFERFKQSEEGQAQASAAASGQAEPLRPASITSDPEQVT